MFTDLMNWFGDASQSSFRILRWLGNSVHINVFFIIILFIAFFIWLKMQADYNRKAKEEGSLK